MTRKPGDDSQAEDTFDRVVADLRELRASAGVVPYAEIARRIGRNRERAANGGTTHTPARSTIYDAFRLGRSRLNAELVAEIAHALGEDDQSVHQWKLRCYRVQATKELTSRPPYAPKPPTPQNATPGERSSSDHKSYFLLILGVVMACISIDGVGHALVGTLHLSLYLDMIGTAVASVALGPWYGVLVAIFGTATGTIVGSSQSRV